MFRDSPINITTAGKRHLGAALGSNDYKMSYIDEKVSEWCKRLTKLSDIAKSQPHCNVFSTMAVGLSIDPERLITKVIFNTLKVKDWPLCIITTN